VVFFVLHETFGHGLATGQWFSPATPVSSTNNTDSHDITEILLKVMLINITVTLSIRFVCITMSCIKVLFDVLLQRGDRECHIVVLTKTENLKTSPLFQSSLIINTVHVYIVIHFCDSRWAF
jgi:HKD family nuclease